MAQIGYGYGSEWQLLRMLGHHRESFYSELRKQLGLSPNADIHWLDYGFNDAMVSGDKEFVKNEFFTAIPHIFTPDALADFEKDKFGQYFKPNWDGIFWVENTVYLVEAKAHLKEILSDCKAESPKSIMKIEQDLQVSKEFFGINTTNDWMKSYYQMANRVAFLKLLLSHGIDAKLVNIYFVDGYEKKVRDPDSDKYYTLQNKNTSLAQWEAAISEEEAYLGIAHLTRKYIFPVFIACKGNF